MCGVCGAIQVDGEPRPVLGPDVLDRMTDVMAHRGPDDRGTYARDGIALGVRRLSIVDVEGGHQPFANEDGRIWAILNGELYNQEDLRRSLGRSGHVFRTRCDTEVLPHLYEEYETGFPVQLRGDYAVAVWDERRRRAVLARDRLGVKPLYWARAGDLILFASELKGILASGLVSPELDLEAIDLYLTFGYVPGPSTLLAGVSKLMPGQRLVVESGKAEIDRYWDYPVPGGGAEVLTEGEYELRLLGLLEESVRLRLMSDVPLGAMLSGGLDSSLVVALMARNMGQPVKTFSVGFSDGAEGNELADARLIAEALGTDHHELELSLASDTVELSELVWHLDEPLADVSALGFLALSELTAKHVTVALSGQGADELLGGYRKHRAAVLAGAWQKLPAGLRAVALPAALAAPARFGKAARTLAADGHVDRQLAMSARFDPELRPRLFRGRLAALDGRAPYRAIQQYVDGLPAEPLAATMYLDGRLALVDALLHYFDHASMAHSLEVRVPFLDHRFVEFCASVPSGLKVRRLHTKHLLKRVAHGLIPESAINKKKVGFLRTSASGWFRAKMREPLADYLLEGSPRYAEFLDQGFVKQLVLEHVAARDETRAELLLSILMLEVWLSDYLPRAVHPPQARPALAG